MLRRRLRGDDPAPSDPAAPLAPPVGRIDARGLRARAPPSGTGRLPATSWGPDRAVGLPAPRVRSRSGRRARGARGPDRGGPRRRCSGCRWSAARSAGTRHPGAAAGPVPPGSEVGRGGCAPHRRCDAGGPWWLLSVVLSVVRSVVPSRVASRNHDGINQAYVQDAKSSTNGRAVRHPRQEGSRVLPYAAPRGAAGRRGRCAARLLVAQRDGPPAGAAASDGIGFATPDGRRFMRRLRQPRSLAGAPGCHGDAGPRRGGTRPGCRRPPRPP